MKKHSVIESNVRQVLTSRANLMPKNGLNLDRSDEAAEGGCGVIGMASNERIPAKHMLRALGQMRNRGNGKGGGIAAAGLSAEQFGVSDEVLRQDYLLAIAYLDEKARKEVEAEFVIPMFEVDHIYEQPQIEEFSSIDGLDVRPPDVVIYFVRAQKEKLSAFQDEHGFEGLDARELEDEFVYQNSFRLNTNFYASLGEKRAFVLSHAKNLLVLKMVGFGDDVIRYYQIEDLEAHVWIGHHRYPTKGRVWHPGGAHPFIGLNEALVHNGDFANHASISEYLAQRNIFPLYLTDTEVAVQVFDLLHRNYRYPLEYVIEAMAPTTERDFTQLPEAKQAVYSQLQSSHMHASPDGPWFFLIAQSDTSREDENVYRLTGITDTSMLRPQVFAWQESGEGDERVSIAMAASEKQAIDAAMESLAEDDARFWSRADRYWNARGGSHTDGGAFLFSVHENESGNAKLTLTDKFGREVMRSSNKPAFHANGYKPVAKIEKAESTDEVFRKIISEIPSWNYESALDRIEGLIKLAESGNPRTAFEVLTLLIDRRYSTGSLRRSSLLALYDRALALIVELVRKNESPDYVNHAFDGKRPEPENEAQIVVVDASGFAAQGEDSLAREIQRLVSVGFKQLMLMGVRGHRFIGNGLGPKSEDVVMDVYGSPGDYLGSGLDGAQLIVHNNAQDQLAQIMKAGRLIVHGDVGQTFMYGAKGGDAYILGNAAGRPLINAVGRPRVVINGTCLDYLAESFMAGDPLDGGGFVILNGMDFNDEGELEALAEPYPGGNLFSLASGGAIYVRDPLGKLTEDQLNGGEYVQLKEADWQLILPYLEENERLFGVQIERLLTVNGKRLPPEQVYRRIQPGKVRALQAEEAWVTSGEGNERVGFH
jgi:glutamate synthase domain-containing protein 1/glutamate synthase domain-containing protein 3